jgi:hypothetical protein
MQDGIYHVRFSGSTHISGEGLVVIKQGTVNGGDPGYLYVGSMVANGDSLTCQLHVCRWNKATASVFGPLDKFDLQLSGKATPAQAFTVTGSMQGNPAMTITIAGRYLAPAA